MPITEAQKQRRKKYLGSSDAPAIVGISPWRNTADVYWDKIRPPTGEESRPNSDAIQVGNYCEEAVLNWFCAETRKKIIRNQSRVHENKIMAASFDALVVGENEAVEAKTSGVTSGYFDREVWGEVETDEIPEYIIIQCQHQMAVMPEINVVWVPVLLGGLGFRKYRIERNESIIKTLEEVEVGFWENHVEKQIPPSDEFLPSLETIKKIRRVPAKTVTLCDDLVNRWLNAKELASKAEKEKNERQKELLAALGDAEAGQCSFGLLTYYEQDRKESLIPASKFRVARFNKPRVIHPKEKYDTAA